MGRNYRLSEFSKATIISLIIPMIMSLGFLAGCLEKSVITDNESLTVHINTNVTEGPAPLYVGFNFSANVNNGKITSYFWNFGDETTSNEKNPTHIFQEKGRGYVVVLTVTDDTGAEAYDLILIRVDPNKPPTGSANASIDSGLYPLTVTFSGTATDQDGEIVDYQWDFDDGTTSNELNVTHTFNEYGLYEVKFTATDNEGKAYSETITIRAGFPIETQKEYDFIMFIIESDEVLTSKIDSIEYAMENLNASSLAFFGDSCRQHAHDYIVKIDHFTDLSHNFSEMKEKYRQILEEYLSIGIGAFTLGDYIDMGSPHAIETGIESLTTDLETLTIHLTELYNLLSLAQDLI